MSELKLSPAHFPVIYSVSLTLLPVSRVRGNSKAVMSQDLGVSLCCHDIFLAKALSEGRSILRRKNSEKIESALEERHFQPFQGH
jgi:hypothetical protein